MAQVYELAFSESGTDIGSVADDTRTRAAAPTAKERPPGWVSMSMTIFFLMVFFAAVSGSTIYVLSDGTMNRALDASKSDCANTVNNITNGFVQLNQEVFARTLEALADALEYRTRGFIAKYSDTIRVLHRYLLTKPTSSLLTWDWVRAQSELLWSFHEAYQYDFFGGVGIVNRQGMLYMLLEVDPEGDAPPRQMFADGTGDVRVGDYSDADSTVIAGLQVGQLEFVQVAALLPNSTSVWTPVKGQAPYFGNLLIASLRDESGWLGSALIVSNFQAISDFLQEAVTPLMGSTHGRAWGVVQSDFISNNSLNIDEPKLLVGASHGQAARLVEEYDAIQQRTVNASYPLTDQTATDPIIRSVATVIDGNYHDLTQLKLMVAEGVPIYVLSRRLRDRLDAGFDWWLVFSVERDYYLGAVLGLKEGAAERLTQDGAEVDSTINSDRQVLVIVTAAILVILSVGCYALALALTSPLNALKKEMGHVADMNLEKVRTASRSKFKEVAGMQDSFDTMIQRLTEFRSFVPASLLVKGEVMGGAAAEPPTGDDITIVFTDIQGSTALWAHSQDAMNAAMDIHNETIRTAVHFYSGYEVKTIGDAFMVAFGDASNAVSFCLSVQRDLLDQEWPADLGLDKVESNGKPLWNGLRIRMGAHCGTAIIEENPITARTDYRGENVAKASRAESVAKGGTVCVTNTLLERVQPYMTELGHPATLDIGGKQLKGITGVTMLHLLTPRALADRLSDETTQAPVVTTSAPRVLSRDQKKTAVRLVNKALTLCIVKVWQGNSLMASLNQVIRVACDLAKDTGGAVSMVWGTEVLVSWNGMTDCAGHTAKAARFAAGVTRRVRSGITLGIVTGKTLHGNVGTSKARFHAIVGRNLKVASALTDLANGLGTPILLADTTNDKRAVETDPLREVVRIVDRWHMVTSEARVVVAVYEVIAPVLRQLIDGVKWHGDSSQGKYPPTADYAAAFHQALRGDLSGLVKLIGLHPADPTLGRIAKLVKYAKYEVTGTRHVSFSTLPTFGGSSVSQLMFGEETLSPDTAALQPEMSCSIEMTPLDAASLAASDTSAPSRETNSNPDHQ